VRYELKDKYSSTIGRSAEDVTRIFKYFLDYSPEETNLIDPSLLTVFRKERLSNKQMQDFNTFLLKKN